MLIGSKNVIAEDYNKCQQRLRCPHDGKPIEYVPNDEQSQVFECRTQRNYECASRETLEERCMRIHPCPKEGHSLDSLPEVERKIVKQCRLERYLKC